MNELKSDMIVSWDKHLANENVWRVEVELPMQDAPEDKKQFLTVEVDVVAPNSDLAGYIVTTMYPDYESLCCNEKPLEPKRNS